MPGSEAWETGFDGRRAWDHVSVLASDSLRGRYSGFAGAEKADAYISSHFQKLGLEEPFEKDGYFHRFTYGAGEYVLPAYFTIRYGEEQVDSAFMWEDYNIYKYSGFGTAKGKLVFVGYGISAPEKGWDELEGVDLEGAVVLAMRGTPNLPNIEWDDERASGFKSTAALERGAVGFMMTQGETPKLATITEKYYRAGLPAVWISSVLADSLIKSTGKTIEEWYEEFDAKPKPVSRELNVEVEFQVSGTYYPERRTQNIVGVIPGSDPELTNEAILIGAHIDHHGVDAEGNIYPGADDNASGAAVVMELAEIFGNREVKPRRSIMFAGFAAEEEGLVGSSKLVEDLPIGDYKIVSMINMDMVGQGDGSLGIAGINEFPKLGEIMFAAYPDSALDALGFWGLYPGSDHASFRKEGIPSYIAGARGDHPNYHTPNDTAGAIKPEILKAVGNMVYHCALNLAEYPEPLSPEVDKAAWLLHSGGGIKFMDLNEEWKAPYKVVKGVNYPEPLAIVNIGGAGGKTGSECLLKEIEIARSKAEECGIAFMADSSMKDYKGTSFAGLTIAVPAEQLPESPEAVKSLERLGLSFIDLTDIVSGRRGINRKSLKKIESLAEICRNTNVKALIRNVDPETASHIAGIWDGQLLYRTNLAGFDWEKYSLLCDTGCFLLLYDQGMKKDSYSQSGEQIKEILEGDGKNDIGVAPSKKLAQSLIDAELSNDEIYDLLQDNLRIWLRDWRANQS